MAKTIGRVDFELTEMPKVRAPGQLPFKPFVNFCAAHSGGVTHDGQLPLLSPQLMTAQEIDEFVSALKADLDAAARRAKRALAASHS